MRQESGSVYVEALVAVAILVIAIIPAFSMFNLTPAVQDQAARHTTALNIARSKLERIHAMKGLDWDNNLLPGTTEATDPDQPAYTVRVIVTWPDPTLKLKDVTVQVLWKDARGGDNEVSLATSVARRPWK